MWSVLVAGLALSLTITLGVFRGNETRAEGKEKKDAYKGAAAPGAGVSLSSEPPAGVPVPPPAGTVPPPPATTGVTPYSPPTPPPPVAEGRDGSLTVQEIFQLRGLKRRVGGENLKRVIDALAD
jgi:hypothetical protein